MLFLRHAHSVHLFMKQNDVLQQNRSFLYILCQKKFQPTKTMLAEEIKIGEPNFKINKKNTSIEKLWTILTSLPLSQAKKYWFS